MSKVCYHCGGILTSGSALAPHGGRVCVPCQRKRGWQLRYAQCPDCGAVVPVERIVNRGHGVCGHDPATSREVAK